MENSSFQSEQDFEDTLSLCDLPLHNHQSPSASPPSSPTSTTMEDLFEFSSARYSPVDNFIFCGKVIPIRTEQNPNPATVTGSFRRRSSGNSSKHKVLIGLAKVPAKMELSDIRKRQSRRVPKPVFPVAAVVGDGTASLAARPLRCRDIFTRALARCMPFVRGYAA